MTKDSRKKTVLNIEEDIMFQKHSQINIIGINMNEIDLRINYEKIEMTKNKTIIDLSQ